MAQGVACGATQQKPHDERPTERPAWSVNRPEGSDPKNPLEMNDRVVTVLSTHLPVLGAAASQQGTKVIGVNQDPCIYRQSDHLCRSASGIEVSGELRVTIRLSAEMIQGIQQGLRGRIHAGPQVMKERYQGIFSTLPRHGAGRFSRFKRLLEPLSLPGV